MQVSVWDTYVMRAGNQRMHFDILVPVGVYKEDQILGFGQEYLDTKEFATGKLTTQECRFCHIEEASEEVVASIQQKGYVIIELEHCI